MLKYKFIVLIDKGGKYEMEQRYCLSKYNTVIEEKGLLLIYNSLSGALSVMEREEWELLNEGLQGQMDHFTEEQHILWDKALINNFIIPADVKEIEILEEKYWQRKNDGSSMTITILPTLGCNFACNYCFQGLKKEDDKMSVEIQNRFLWWFRNNLDGVKSVNLTWFGGEPTLGMDIIKRLSDRMIALCDQRCIKYTASIITNGSLLNPDMVGELYVRRVSLFQVTIDGPSEIHNKVRFDKKTGEGSFEKIIENIKLYQSIYPVRTSLRINVDARNEEKCFELIDELAEKLKGVKNTSVYFAPIHASTSYCEHISAYTLEIIHYAELETKLLCHAVEKGLARIGLPVMSMGLCGATKKYGIVIVPNGDIHKCWETVSMPEYRIGNILDETFKLEEQSANWRNWSPFREKECQECKILPNCLGMCTYRFLYKENYCGNSALSPCPSLKFEIQNRLRMYVNKYYKDIFQKKEDACNERINPC